MGKRQKTKETGMWGEEMEVAWGSWKEGRLCGECIRERGEGNGEKRGNTAAIEQKIGEGV